MKKLMTMLAAAAMAFGLYADAITPIDSFDASDEGATLTDGRWSLAGEAITAPIDEAKIEDSLLKIQTGSKKLTREFLDASASTNIPADGLYFDINLSFLDPVDGSDALADDLGDAKIAAAVIDNSDALKEIPGTQLTPSTNLYVIGGYWDGGAWTNRAYMFQNADLSGTAEKRLTVKMYDTVLDGAVVRPGFRFFVGGVDKALKVKYTFPILKNGTIDFANPTAVSETPNYLGVAATELKPAIRSRYSDANLIVSLLGGASASAVSAVDFVGKANIADFKLTEDPMFIGPDASTMKVVKNAGVTKVDVTGAEYDKDTGTITFAVGTEEITVDATYADGCTLVTWTYDGGELTKVTDAQYTLKPIKEKTLMIKAVAPAAYVGDKPFENFFGNDPETCALAYVNENGGTLKLAQDATDAANYIEFTNDDPGIVLDLAGRTITGGDYTTIFNNGGLLTITNSVGEGHVAVFEGSSIINAGTLTIAEGVIDGSIANGFNETPGTLYIIGGTFDGAISSEIEGNVLETTGGLFKNTVFAQKAIPGVDYETYEAVDNGDGYWKVQQAAPKDYVAQVVSADGQTTTPYESLKEAAEVAQAGDTVEVLKDHTFTESFTFFNKGTNDADTINFVNNFEIKSSLAADNYAMFIVGSKVNWSGTGTLIKEYGTASAILVGSGEKAGHSGRPAELGNGYLTFSGNLKGGTNDTYIAGYGAGGTKDGGAPSNLIKCEAGFCRFNGGTLVNTRTDSTTTKRNGRCVCASAAGGYTGVVEVATCDFIANEPLYQENGGIMKFVGGSSSNARVKQNQGLELDYGKYCTVGQTFVYNEDGENKGWWTVGLYTFNIVVTDGAEAQGTAQPASFTTETFTNPFEVTLTKPTAPKGKEFASWSANYGEITGEKLTLTALPTANESVVVTVVWKDIAVTSVSLNKEKLELDIGAEETLVATVLPETAIATVVWASDADAVATVDQNGKVTAVANGTANITATAGGITATCEVTVKAAGPVYPSYIPEGAPEEIKERYAGWASKYSVTDGEGKMDYYLLDCDPADADAFEAAQKAFKIASIENVDGAWQVKVVNPDGIEELLGQNDQYLNGYVNIISVKATKFPTAGEGADFFQAQLTIQPTLK